MKQEPEALHAQDPCRICFTINYSQLRTRKRQKVLHNVVIFPFMAKSHTIPLTDLIDFAPTPPPRHQWRMQDENQEGLKQWRC
jgi:hypothetical protein